MAKRKSRATLVAETIMMVENALREEGIEIEAIPTTQTVEDPLAEDYAKTGKRREGIKVYLDFQIVKFYPDSEES